MAEESDRREAEVITAPTPEALLACAYEVLAMVAQDCVRGLKTAVAEAKGDPMIVLGRVVRAIGGLARAVRLVAELSLRPPKRRNAGDEDMTDKNDGGGDDAERLERMRIEIQHNFDALRRVRGCDVDSDPPPFHGGGGAMTNGVRGEVSAILAGAPRRLCLTLGALAEMETELGVSGMAALAERLRALSAGDLTVVLAALLRGGGEHELAGALATAPVDPRAAAEAVARAFEAAAPSVT